MRLVFFPLVYVTTYSGHLQIDRHIAISLQVSFPFAKVAKKSSMSQQVKPKHNHKLFYLTFYILVPGKLLSMHSRKIICLVASIHSYICLLVHYRLRSRGDNTFDSVRPSVTRKIYSCHVVQCIDKSTCCSVIFCCFDMLHVSGRSRF